MKKLLIILVCISFNISSGQLKKIQTNKFDVVSASPGLDFVLGHAIRCSHNALNFQKKIFDYEPKEKIFVLFEDFGDFGNGGATSLPTNLVTACISPMNYCFE